MIVKLLTEHDLEFLRLTGGCRLVRVYTCQNVKLLEISFCGTNEDSVRNKEPVQCRNIWSGGSIT